MSKVQTHRAPENERLTADTEEECEEEPCSSEGDNQSGQQALSPGVLRVSVGVGVPSGLGLDQDIAEAAPVKEESDEQIVKYEDEEQPVCVRESSAVCEKKDPSPRQQRQTEHRKGTQGQDVNPESERDTHHSGLSNNGVRARPFSCLAPQRTVGDHYNQLQIRDRSTAPQSSAPPFDYKKPFSCSVCKKTFSKKAQLDVHTRTHTGEKPFSCQFCQKLFAKKSNLDLHVRLHTGEKPYRCQYCEKTFAQISNLKVHMRTHTGEKPYSCSECEKTFAQHNTLKAHMKTHVTDRLHDCAICAKSFIHKTNLDVHMRIHTGEKPYSCDFCEKTFNQNSNLKAHLRIHTGEKPYGCSMCEKTFAQKGTLDGHVKLHLQREAGQKCSAGND